MWIFNLSSGYSGTGFAASLLARSPDCLAEHEAEPTLFGPWTALWNETSGPADAELIAVVRCKLAQADARRRAAGKAHYADTSHGFVKGWGPAAIEAGLISPDDTRLIHTTRARAKVLRAMVALRMIPGGASFPCDHYWLDPHARRNRIELTTPAVQQALTALAPVCRDGFFATQLVQAGWYVLEIDARIADFRARFPDFSVCPLDLETLDATQLKKVFSHCGLTPPEKLEPTPVNTKTYLYDVPLAWAECALDALCKALEGSTMGCCDAGNP